MLDRVLLSPTAGTIAGFPESVGVHALIVRRTVRSRITPAPIHEEPTVARGCSEGTLEDDEPTYSVKNKYR
jgi:hypothetical protein